MNKDNKLVSLKFLMSEIKWMAKTYFYHGDGYG
jgi:hypothetical protein